MRKGIGPRGLGAPKSAAKMMKSPGKMASGRPRSTRQMERDYTLAEKNPQKAAKRAVRLSDKAEKQFAKGKYNKGNVTQARAETLKFKTGMSPIKMGMKSPAKMDGNPLKDTVKKIDAKVSSNIQKSSIKPAAEKGSFQEFVNDGPVPFVRRGYNKAKKAVKKVTGSTYGTSI